MRRFLRYCLILILGLLASACQGEVSLDVDIDEDGSGLVALTVSVDGEFIEVFGSLSAVTVDDLVNAGWSVENSAAPEGETIRIAKPFAKMEDIADVIAEIDGPDGLFNSVTLIRIDERDSVRYEFAMQVDLTRRITDLSDSELTSALDGRAFGFEPGQLTTMAGGPLESVLLVNVHVNLVGEELDFSDSLDANETFPLTLETTIVDQGALDLRDEAQNKRNTAAVLGLVFLVATFAFWLFMRVRYTYVYEGEYGYAEDETYGQYPQQYGQQVAVPTTQQQYAQPAQPQQPAPAQPFEPGPEHVWSDGQGWVLAPEETPPSTPESDEAKYAPPPAAQDIEVSGGSVDMSGADTPEDSPDTPDDDQGSTQS